MHQPMPAEVLYYVTAREGRKTAFLLGPYVSHPEALARVERGKELAERTDPYAWFYAYGTASCPASQPVTVLFPDEARP